MSTSVRYKEITNATGAVFSSANLPAGGDGNDKQYRIIKRTLAAIDVGTDTGKTRGTDGCIVDQLPASANVLSIEGSTYRAGKLLDSFSVYTPGTDVPTFFQAVINYSVNASKQVIVKDAGGDATVHLAANDVVIIKLVIGPTP